VDEQRNRGRDDEGVAEAAEAVARLEVEPGEEDAGEDEMADEVEDVHRLYDFGHSEEEALQRLLPGEMQRLLQVEDPVRVRDGQRPVRRHEMAQVLVDLEAAHDDRRLHEQVAPGEPA
jgi:hypothetical protein